MNEMSRRVFETALDAAPTARSMPVPKIEPECTRPCTHLEIVDSARLGRLVALYDQLAQLADDFHFQSIHLHPFGVQVRREQFTIL